MQRKNRWYDKYPQLALLLESLCTIKGSQRNTIISGIMEIIKLTTPNLLEQYVIDFPLDIKRRRWYDRDPYLWLIFNGLKYANSKLLTTVTRFLQKEISGTVVANKKASSKRRLGKEKKNELTPLKRKRAQSL
jgi:hypothetical protein